MRKTALIVVTVPLAALGAMGCAAASASDDSSVKAENIASWAQAFIEHPTVKALDEDARGLDPRTQKLSSAQCRLVLGDYDAVLKKAPMPPYKQEDFKHYLEESRKAYVLACNGITGEVLNAQVEDALVTQHEWARSCREEFPQVKQNFVYLKDFPF